jgi:phospholipid-binding lipoprotein MlaA
VALVCLGCTQFSFANTDPWEGMNRGIYGFNDRVDTYFLRPVAKAYGKLPRPVRRGVGNFFTNLQEPANALNQLLQGKPVRSLSDGGRFLVNSTLGIGGLIDVATPVGLQAHQEDFGQTLGRWGLASGNYLVLPFAGSSSMRDALGRVVDMFTNPVGYLEPDAHRYALGAIYVVDLREELLSAEKLIVGDEYVFIRDSYLQRRSYLVNDGAIEDDGFDDFDDDD